MLRGAALGAASPLIPATAATATAATATAAAATAAAAPATVRGSDRAAGSASWRWLGTAGWRIDVGDRTVLFDPYLTRFPTGLFDGAFDPGTRLRTRPEVVDAHIGRPELVLVSHSHWDHLGDVPHIARTTGARVVGTETTYHLLVSLGVDPGQISVVKGGEVLDFGGGITVEVVPSLHSRNKKCAYFAPGTLNAPPVTAPETISDLPEGDTLAFQVTAGDSGPSAFLMGASDFSERAVRGLRPDLAMIAVPAGTATHRYVPRLLRALDSPGVVVPVHWDNFEVPLSGSPVRDPSMDLEAFLTQVEEASPATRIVVPDYRTVYDAAMRPGSRR
ncbi:MBL fold metallo-hydrolase [Streptomyces hirsutus]|uniref:MBL fold metallo-hydrolase n=1 Tax=Streptomyces hirsutus TaxID=35620 RepID=UPI00364464AE